VLNAPKLPLLMEEHTDFLRAEIGYRLSFLMKENKIKKKDRVLFVGIGNPAVPADAFGVKTVEKISIMPFKKKNRIFKIMPNVFLNTGLNAYDVIHLIVEAFDIDTVVLVDSLATKNIARLGTSIQFNDAGLTPGSALNNFGMPINKGTLKVPCICVGVPFMISAKEIGAKRDVFLTDKDVESQVEFLSSLVAEVLDGLM
ncbi:MAG: GPR endopeptidase, partial [Clostridia bacterium]|nr:GPR endopeptidase [Clostridia bacterium]